MNNADLIVSSVTIPSEGLLGMPLSLLWTVTNQGTSTTLESYWYDGVYISDDTTLDPSDTSLAFSWISNPLLPGNSYTASTTVQLQGINPGNYYLFFKTDNYNYLNESNRNNNTYFAPILVTAPNVDLVISSATAPINAALGETISIAWTGTNLGTEAATSSFRYDQVYLSEDATFDSLDTYLTSQYLYDPLDSNASYSQSLDVSIPNNIKPGSRYLVFVANSERYQAETNFQNNTYTIPITLLGPDLTVSGVSVPTTANLGDSIDISWTISNQGPASASSDRSDRVYFSKDAVWDANDRYLKELSSTPLQSGESVTTTTAVTLPVAGGGDGYLLFVVDSTEQQGESDETNNVFAAPINVTGPDLRVTGATAPANATLGQTINVSWSVINQGNSSALGYEYDGGGYGSAAAASFVAASAGAIQSNAAISYQPWYDGVYLSSDTQWDYSDVFLGSQSTTSLPLNPNDSYTINRSVTLPTSVNGAQQYLLFITDSYGYQGETDENNNVYALPIDLSGPDLVVSSATAPTEAALGELFGVSWTVTNQGDLGTAAGYQYDSIYVSSDPYLDYADTVITATSTTRQLNPDDSYTVNQNIRLGSTTVGDRYLLFVADSYPNSYSYSYSYNNRQGEINEANNVRAIPIHLTGADLIVAAASTPTTATLGETLSVSWTVTNQGTATASADWWDAVYLSDDPYLNTSYYYSDIYLTGAFAGDQTPLAAGESYTLSANISIPNVSPGAKYLIFVGDSSRAQAEGNDNNNYYAVPIVLTAPDLVVSATTSPATAVVGDSFAVSWTVTNQGSTDALNDWSDVLYISNDEILDWTDTVVLSESVGAQTPLAAGASYTITKNVLLPNTSPGGRYLLFAADRWNNQRETNENNNVKAVAINLTPNQADLSVAVTTDVPAKVSYGDVFDLSWTVSNQGNNAANATWTNAVYLSSDAVFDVNDRLLTSQSSPAPLSVGSQYAVTQSVAIPNWSTVGPQYLLVVADPNNVQAESNETNNFQALAIEVVVPDLTVNSVIVPSSGQFGQSLTVSWTVKNIGTGLTKTGWEDIVWLSTDDVLSNDDIMLLQQPAASPLAPNAEYTRTETISLPLNHSLNDGNYRIIVGTDASGNVRELNEGNNQRISDAVALTMPPLPNLVVSNITTPPEGWSGQTFDVTWTVTNNGLAATQNNWIDRVYLVSPDNTNPDIYLGDLANPIDLVSGQSYTRSQTYSLPNGINGNYQVAVRTDVNDTVFETNPGEADNQAQSAVFPVNLTPYADLQVGSVLIPSTAIAGQQATFTWTVTNNGIGATDASNWTDQLYLSTDATLDSGDIFLGGARNLSYLAAGESYNQSLTTLLPNNLNGNFYAIAVTDGYNNQYEYDFENNNAKASVGRIQVTPPSLGYLHVVEVKLAASTPSTLFGGQTVTATWTVENTGDSVVTPSANFGFWDDAFALSSTPTWNGTGYWLGGHKGYRRTPLAPGERYTHSANISLPSNLSGTWYLVSVPDTHFLSSGNGIGSSVVPRDQGSIALNFQLPPSPDLQVLSVTTSSTGSSGQPIAVSWTVSNEGFGPTSASTWTDQVYLSSTPTFDASTAILLGSFAHNGSLNAVDQYARTESFVLPSGISGNYYVFVATDVANQVFEHVDGYDAEVNNRQVSSTPIAIVLTPPPDLQITALTVPATASSGQAALVSWSVTNNGTTSTGTSNWSDSIVLSADNSLSTTNDNIVLSTISHSGALAPGASYTQSQNVVLPKGISGNYNIFLITDAFNQVTEYAGDDNNSTSAVIPITLTPPPDLQVTNLTVPAGASGQGLVVSWTVTNGGSGATPESTWLDNLYLAIDGTVIKSLGQVRHNGPLAAGASYVASQTVKLPVGLSGDYQILVVTDTNNEVFENTDEANNASTAALSITLTPPPDLQVSSVDAPTAGYANQPITINWTTTNVGTGGTESAYWFDSVYLSKDKYLDLSVDKYLGSVERSGALAVGGSYSASLTANLPVGASGPYYAFVITDSRNNVFEGTAETNNSSYDPVALQVTLAPPADLVVNNITVPTTGTIGQISSIPFTWTVTNQGTNTAVGTWVDAVYLSADGNWDASDQLIARVEHTGDIAPGASYTASTNAPLPAAIPGNYRAIVRSDIRNSVREVSDTNNQGVSGDPVAVNVAELAFGQPTADSLSNGQNRYYRINAEAGDDIVLKADFATAGNRQFYVRYGAPPTLTTFDQVYSSPSDLAQQIKLSGTRPGSYYLLVHGQEAVANQPFTLSAEKLDFGISSISTNHGSNRGQVTLAIDGAKFTAAAQVQLIAADGSVRSATKVSWKDSSELWATFDLQGLAAAQYDVRVTENNKTSTLQQAFTVNTGAVGQVETRLIVPNTGRPRQPSEVMVEYTNRGETDVVAPLLSLSVTNGLLKAPDGSDFEGSSLQFLGISDDGPAGILAPGATGRFRAMVKSTGTDLVDVQVNLLAENETIDWSSMRSQLGIDKLPVAAQDQIIANLTSSVGTTAGQYQAALARDASTFSLVGDRISNVTTLFNFELNKATNNQAIVQRNTLGKFGRGWTAPVESHVTTDGSGNVTLIDSGILKLLPTQLQGTALYIPADEVTPAQQLRPNAYRLSIEQFLPQGGKSSEELYLLQADGSYNGEHGKLTKEINHYELQLDDGTLYVFRSDGQLDFVQDDSGYRITAGYSNGRLSSFTSSSGDHVAFNYNAQQRISSISDLSGQNATFSYDATGQYLTQSVSPTTTLSYGYNDLQNPSVLTTVTASDGSKATFVYDAQGRVIQQFVGNGEESKTYSYNDTGSITVTDANGNISEVFNNANGQAARIIDSLGRITQFSYDSEGHLSKIIAPDNAITSFAHDGQGNLIQQVNALGQTTSYTYTSNLGLLESITDDRGNGQHYSYDSTGNLKTITYADGSTETFNYDGQRSLLTQSTNRRNQSINYVYNDKYQIIQETYPGGSVVSYTYNPSSGELSSITDSHGTTSVAYDSANRILTLTYPGGRNLQYTFDAEGRRTQLVQDGATTNYTYDAVGRLDKLTDVSGNTIVDYTYNSATGDLSREDRGNGTYTTYEYNAAGQIQHLIHHAADGAVSARFDYTYNISGQVSEMSTLDGAWTYTYDVAGQLIHAVFGSTNTSIPSQDLTYVYDSAGNRIQTIENGSTTNYQANNLNEYTSIGTATYGYDADGNLTSKTQGSQSWQYSYDAQNRLVQVADSGNNITQYEYNVFGQRSATVFNGQRTEYLMDPLGFGNILAEYDASGSQTAQYTHGLGLVSRATSGGAAYYNFDKNGSTASLTGADGTILNRYEYRPFGEDFYESESVTNPFEYVGQFGITEEANGLDFMRARFYDSQLGRFTTTDPTGLQGLSSNLYGYTENNPIAFIDPSGESRMLPNMGPIDSKQVAKDLMTKPGTLNPGEAGLVSGVGGLAFGCLYRANGGPGDLGFRAIVAGTAGLAVAGALVVFTGGAALPAVVAGASFAGGFLLGSGGCGPNPPAPSQPTGPGGPNGSLQPVSPMDPNDIIGPSGFGAEKWISSTATLPYTIRFENQATATAPAQQIVVTQTLDPDLDIRTFRLGDFGWGDLTFQVPEGRSFYSQRLDLTASNGFLVDVVAGIDVAKGQAFWTLTTIDPATGEKPENPLIGLLPPNIANDIGQGFLNYSIRPKATVATGTVIDAQARIVFDTEAPIDTPAISNTLDASKPTSSVNVLPSLVNDAQFVVQWGGQDDSTGSGLAGYTIYVSKDGGAYSPWLDKTTLTEATFSGDRGHSYAFYSVAQDNAGNSQVLPLVAQATTRVSGGAPVLAVNSPLALNEGTVATLTNTILSATDADNTPAELVYSLTNLPGNGVLLLNGTALAGDGSFTQADLDNGLVTYQHNGSETIQDAFQFTVSDPSGNRLENVTFGIQVTPVNDAPIANANKTLTLLEDAAAIALNITAPTDAENDTLTIAVTALPNAAKGAIRLANGTAVALNQILSLGELQQLIFAPVADANGAAGSFSYTVSDGNGGTATQSVTIDITPVNDAPIALGETATTYANTPLTLTAATLLANDTDIDGDTLSLISVSNAVNGTVALNTSGNVVFTPSNGFSGTASFQYTISDGNATTTAGVTIAVTAIDPPLVLQGTSQNNTLIGGSNNDQLYGNAGNDTLIGNAGDDLLDGGSGNDSLVGGTGNDTYIVNALGDVIVENAGEGIDTVKSSISWTLADNLEILELTGTNVINGTGNSLDNTLTGNASSNLLDGKTGADTMRGGSGNDVYVVDNLGDVVLEDAGGGTDRVDASISYALVANVENLTLLGTAISGTGNELNNTITGNDGDNILDGQGGNDRLVGGKGNDTYYVDNVGDVIIEAIDAGVDAVIATVDFSLRSAANVENLTLIGTATTATGNTLGNILIGNQLDNKLYGREGDDTLIGGVGNDLLDGGTGADQLTGGDGNDTYFVDNVNDLVIELASQGSDTVTASINYTLTDNVETLILSGIATRGSGNDLNNTISGNSRSSQLYGLAGDDLLTGGSNADTLDGGLGIDTLQGRGGNDTYYVDDANDLVVELAGQGTDLVVASVDYVLAANVENLILTGTAINGTGNDSNNNITGNAGDNILTGGKGNDTLSGGAGVDTFILNQPSQGIDTIKDFISGTDKIGVSATDYSGLVAGTTLSSNQIRIGASITTANSATQRFLFNTTNGNLYFDADGVGGVGAVQIAKLEGVTSLSINDFQIRS